MNGQVRRVAGRARSRVRLCRERWACQAVEAVVQGQDGPVLTGDELVESSLLIAPTACRRFTLGASPTDSRVTLLADLREPGALPPTAFVRIVLVRPFSGRRKGKVTANLLDALLPGGELVAIMSKKSQRTLQRGGFEEIEVSRSNLARVVHLRRRG